MALLTRISTRPNLALISPNMRLISEFLATSAQMSRLFEPSSAASFAVALAVAGSMSLMTTWAPSRA
jgi:hypothetical protein